MFCLNKFAKTLANSCEKCNYFNMNSLKTHIKNLVGVGKYFFTKQEILSQFDISEA